MRKGEGYFCVLVSFLFPFRSGGGSDFCAGYTLLLLFLFISDGGWPTGGFVRDYGISRHICYFLALLAVGAEDGLWLFWGDTRLTLFGLFLIAQLRKGLG